MTPPRMRPAMRGKFSSFRKKKKVRAWLRVTKNSAMLTEPITIRGWWPFARRVEVIGADPRLKLFAREVGEDVGARDAADDARKAEFQKEGFIDVLMKEMANTTDPSGKNFGDFDRVADHGGGGAEGEEEGGAGDSVGHAEGAIDDLADESDEDGDEEDWGHGEKSNRKRCSADLKKG